MLLNACLLELTCRENHIHHPSPWPETTLSLEWPWGRSIPSTGSTTAWLTLWHLPQKEWSHFIFGSFALENGYQYTISPVLWYWSSLPGKNDHVKDRWWYVLTCVAGVWWGYHLTQVLFPELSCLSDEQTLSVIGVRSTQDGCYHVGVDSCISDHWWIEKRSEKCVCTSVEWYLLCLLWATCLPWISKVLHWMLVDQIPSKTGST